MKKYFIILFLITVCQVFSEDPYIGYFKMPNGKFIIEIKKVDEEYVGHVKWLKDLTYPKGDPMEGIEQVDRRNPNSNLRNRKVMNLRVVGGLKLDKQGTSLVDGWIYDTWNGKKYYGSAKMIDDDSLSLRGSMDPWGVLGYSIKAQRVQLPKEK